MPKHADDELQALFAERTHHREILIDMVDTREGSRFGGQPPASLAAAPPRCPVCVGALQYVLTLAGDTLGEEIARGKAVSLLACREYACLMTSHALTEPSSTVLGRMTTPRVQLDRASSTPSAKGAGSRLAN